jgi:plasmid maintenance system antidote protein VapI
MLTAAELIEKSGIRQTDLAELCKVDKSTLCNIAKGRRNISAKAATRLARATGYVVRVHGRDGTLCFEKEEKCSKKQSAP